MKIGEFIFYVNASEHYTENCELVSCTSTFSTNKHYCVFDCPENDYELRVFLDKPLTKGVYRINYIANQYFAMITQLSDDNGTIYELLIEGKTF